MKPVGELYAGNRHVWFDERGWETGRCRMAQVTAPILDSTIPAMPAGSRMPDASVLKLWVSPTGNGHSSGASHAKCAGCRTFKFYKLFARIESQDFSALRNIFAKTRSAHTSISRQAKIGTMPRLRRGLPDVKNPLQCFFSTHWSHSSTYAFFQSEIDCSA